MKARLSWLLIPTTLLFAVFSQGCKLKKFDPETQAREDSVRVKAKTEDSLRKADSLNIASQPHG